MRENENLEDTLEQPAPEGMASDVDATQETPDLGAELDRLKAELAEAQEKVDEYWQRVLRAQAEQDNTRKRAERDVQNAHKYALEKFVGDLLPVLDSLEMGLVAAAENADADKIREGIELTLKMFLDAMKKYGVEPVNPVGEAFDPQLHQAMSMQPSNEVPPNTVTAVMQKGYLLNDRLVRPAMVMVSKEG
jgi:molecular chaperone GrpE